MLANLLEDTKAEILGRLPFTDQVADLLTQLIRALRDGSGPPPLRRGSSAAHLRALRQLEHSVSVTIEERGSAASARDAWLVARWFAAAVERTLSDENRRLVTMLDALPDHLILQDRDGRLLFVNSSAADLATAVLGRSREEVLGLSVMDGPLSAAFKRYAMDLVARARRGETFTEEFVMPGPNGPQWRESHMAPVYGGDGEVEAIAIASRDIHARKLAESRLFLLSKIGALVGGDSSRVLTGLPDATIPELADVTVLEVTDDRGSRFTVANSDRERIAAIETRLSAGESVADVLAEQGAISTLAVPILVDGSEIATLTFAYTPQSGRRHEADDRAIAEEIARRTTQIVENARLQEQLTLSEARFRVALQHSNISVFEEDVTGRVRWKYNAPDFRDDTPPEELAPLRERVLATGEGARTSLRATVAGEPHNFLVTYEPLRHDNDIVGLTGAAVDVTELTRAHEELAQALAFRERVMGILGHDLRNPLAAVLSLSALLAKRADVSERTKEALGHIRHSAERMDQMIRTVLDFTRLRFRGTPPLDLESFDLDGLVGPIVEEFRAAHPNRELIVAVSGDVRGRWDCTRMGQVVSNLVGNALTHGSTESPIVVNLFSENGFVLMEVSNRGPTIPPNTLDKLFEPFWQGATDSKPRGLGLGLFIAQQIVQAHGGVVAVRSQDGNTTFTVQLPRGAS